MPDTSRGANGQEISGAGGIPLATLAGKSRSARAGDPVIAELAALGFTDAEQVVAAASVPGVLDKMRSLPGVGGDAVDALLKRARSSLAPTHEALVANPAPPGLGLGVTPPSDDMIAAAEASAAQPRSARTVAVPAAVNLIPHMPSIRNQAARGTCVSFTLTALNEYVLRRRGIVQDLSEQHLYYEIKLIDGNPDGCGTHQSRAVHALSGRGQCPEAIWPYDPNTPCNNHGALPLQARPAGQNYRLAPYAVPARDVMSYKEELAGQRPVTLSIPVYDSWYSSAETRRSGRITMRIGPEDAPGGHAVLLVGYQDSDEAPGGGYFIVRNSWGTTNWGYQCPYGAGHGTIPYQYISNDAWEAYSVVVPGLRDDVDAPRNFDVVGAGNRSTVTIQVGSNVTITVESE